MNTWPQAARVLVAVWNHPLNAHGRLAALTRVLRWQWHTRLGSGDKSVPFVDATRLAMAPGQPAASGNWYCGLLEAGEMAFALHLLRPGDLFVDAGANVGSYSVLAAGAAGAETVALEPVPGTLAALRQNLALNGLESSVQVRAVAVGERAGRLRFTTGLGSANRLLGADETLASVEAEVWTLDELLGDATPLLIKIDIEGQELAALRGATRLLARKHLRALIVETDSARAAEPEDNSQLHRLLTAQGFEPCAYDPHTRTLRDSDTAGCNTLFLRDRAWIEARLRTARRYRLVNGWI